MVYQDVMRNSDLEPESKTIYAYLASFAGNKDTCHPSRKLMLKELKMSEQRFSKYMNALVASGVVKVVRERNGNVFGKNIYTLTHEVIVLENEENANFRRSENRSFENGSFDFRSFEDTHNNNNSLNSNRLNNNSINYQQIADMYNEICISFPHLTKLSDSRKKAIKARLKQYGMEDFQKLFTMAEESSFLKGQNNRNWSATFDWLIKDTNMAKVLDGNYADRGSSQSSPQKMKEYELPEYLQNIEPFELTDEEKAFWGMNERGEYNGSQ